MVHVKRLASYNWDLCKVASCSISCHHVLSRTGMTKPTLPDQIQSDQIRSTKPFKPLPMLTVGINCSNLKISVPTEREKDWRTNGSLCQLNVIKGPKQTYQIVNFGRGWHFELLSSDPAWYIICQRPEKPPCWKKSVKGRHEQDWHIYADWSGRYIRNHAWSLHLLYRYIWSLERAQETVPCILK